MILKEVLAIMGKKKKTVVQLECSFLYTVTDILIAASYLLKKP